MITVSVKIAEHDLAVKVNHMREFLEKKHSVKLWVKTKVRRQEYTWLLRGRNSLECWRRLQRVWKMWLSKMLSRTFIGTDWCAHCRGQHGYRYFYYSCEMFH